MAKPKFDPAETITREIIAILEKGTLPWRKPWTGGGEAMPLRSCGTPYSGINSFLLSMRAIMAGHGSPIWMTMKQANDLDARIRKGSKSSLVVYYGQSHKKAEAQAKREDSDETGPDGESYRFLKSYRVFNASQIEGLDDSFFPEPKATNWPGASEIPELEAWFSAIGADVVRTGTQACYMPALDRIYIPEITRFADPEKFYATLAHEHVHYTKLKGRLNRSFGATSFGNGAYAKEELVAEIGAALICRQHGLSPHHIENSAAYIDHWISILKADHRFLFKAGAHAQRAVDYLNEAARKGGADPVADDQIAEAA